MLLIMKECSGKSVLWWTEKACYYFLIPILAGYAVILLTGFYFGINNNVYHIPYVLHFTSNPEFLHDAYYRSMDNFTSIVWPLVRLFATEDNVEQVFYIACLFSRIMAFAALVYLVRLAGLQKPVEVLLAMVVLILMPLLQNTSIAGDHGMFESYFTHSETTWAFVFLSVGLLYADRIVPAYAMMGIAFSINAFVGIWLLGMNTLVLLAAKKSIAAPMLLKAVCGFAMFALPTGFWIFFTLTGKHQAVDFSYIDYIRSYYPQHFLVETAVGWSSMIKHLLLVCSGLLAARFLPDGRFWAYVQLAALLILLVGIPLPYLFNNRFIFNLHLIRSAGLGQAFAAVLLALACIRLLLQGETPARRIIGMVVLLSLTMLAVNVVSIALILISMLAAVTDGGISSRFSPTALNRRGIMQALSCLVLFLLALLLDFYQDATPFTAIQGVKLAVFPVAFGLLELHRHRRFRIADYVVGVLLLYTVILGSYRVRVYRETRLAERMLPENRSWTAMMDSIKSSDLQGPFLLPMDDHEHTDYFQLQARRRVWVDWKQGAAVMWSPSFYRQWSTRYREVSALHSSPAMVSYARAHRIRYVVLHAQSEGVPAACRLLKWTPHYRLYEVL